MHIPMQLVNLSTIESRLTATPLIRPSCFYGHFFVTPLIRPTATLLPWIPEPSTVNNKLQRREGSGSTGRFFD
jgi:hypothetical protein